MASGGRHGLAQSVFQVGGNFGTADRPAAGGLHRRAARPGRASPGSRSPRSLGMILLCNVGIWYRHRRRCHAAGRAAVVGGDRAAAPPGRRRRSRSSALLIFSKFLYMASLTSYYTFYLIDRFGVSVQPAQLLLFVFLVAVAAGTLVGGPLGDRFGRKFVIWVLDPRRAAVHPGAALCRSVLDGGADRRSSAWSCPRPSRRSWCMGRNWCRGRSAWCRACSSASPSAWAASARRCWAKLADLTSIEFVYKVCSFLPAIGLLTLFLPNIGGSPRRPKPA